MQPAPLHCGNVDCAARNFDNAEPLPGDAGGTQMLCQCAAPAPTPVPAPAALQWKWCGNQVGGAVQAGIQCGP
jgi:hypothetical protein